MLVIRFPILYFNFPSISEKTSIVCPNNIIRPSIESNVTPVPSDLENVIVYNFGSIGLIVLNGL